MQNSLKIEVLKKGEGTKLEELVLVFAKVFEKQHFNLPPGQHLLSLLQSENFVAIVAYADDQLIGGLTVHVLSQYYSTRPQAYIYDLGVLPGYQRVGVGSQLIGFTVEYFRRLGLEEVFVQAERADDQAIRFYRKTQPSAEEAAIQFSYWL